MFLEIPEIPDLEEMPDPAEDIAFQVAEAPELVLKIIIGLFLSCI